MIFNEENLGLVFTISTGKDKFTIPELDEYCISKMKEYDFKKWILISLEFDLNNNRKINFKEYQNK